MTANAHVAGSAFLFKPNRQMSNRATSAGEPTAVPSPLAKPAPLASGPATRQKTRTRCQRRQHSHRFHTKTPKTRQNSLFRTLSTLLVHLGQDKSAKKSPPATGHSHLPQFFPPKCPLISGQISLIRPPQKNRNPPPPPGFLTPEPCSSFPASPAHSPDSLKFEFQIRIDMYKITS